MIFLYAISFLLMAGGCLIILNMTPLKLLSSLPKPHRKERMATKIKRSVKPKRPRGMKKIVIECKGILKSTNKSSRFSSLCVLSFSLLVLGVLVASAMGNLFLVPVLAAGFAMLPFLYILLISFKYKKQLNEQLETALSIITAEYIRSENFISAVSENIQYLDSPVKEVFTKFLAQATMISSNVTAALEEMKGGIANDVFREWVDAVILCQSDRNLKSTLLPIVNKLSDMRIVSGELNYQLYGPFKEYIIMALVLVFEPLFLRSQSADWYNILMHTTVGQILLAANAAILFISLIRVIRLTKPVEYRR